MSMLPPASVGGTESTRAEVSRATPRMPRKRVQVEPDRHLAGEPSAQPVPTPLDRREDADVAALVEVGLELRLALELLRVLPGQSPLAVPVGDHAVGHPQRQVEHLDLEDVTGLGAAHRDRAGDHVRPGAVVLRRGGHGDRVGEHVPLGHAVRLEERARVLALVLEHALVGDRVHGDHRAGAHHGDGSLSRLGSSPVDLVGEGPHVASAGATAARLEHPHGARAGGGLGSPAPARAAEPTTPAAAAPSSARRPSRRPTSAASASWRTTDEGEVGVLRGRRTASAALICATSTTDRCCMRTGPVNDGSRPRRDVPTTESRRSSRPPCSRRASPAYRRASERRRHRPPRWRQPGQRSTGELVAGACRRRSCGAAYLQETARVLGIIESAIGAVPEPGTPGFARRTTSSTSSR